MKQRRKYGWLLALVTLLGVLGICVAGTAVAGDDLTVELLRVDGKRVECTIGAETARENVRVIAATYNGEQMCQQYNRLLDIPAEGWQFVHSFEQEFDSCKVFLLDGDTESPICKNGGPEQVRFLDHDGTVLYEQTVYTGQAALPPVAPEQSGSVFKGWEGDYTAVYGPCDVTATYVAQTADNLFTVTSVDSAPGEEVTVRVALGGTVELCGYDMNLYYDDTVLEFVRLDSELSMDVLANHIAGEGRVKFNFGTTKNRTKAGNILDITFRVKECESRGTPLRLGANSVICVDPQDGTRFLNVDYTLCEGVIRIL